MYVDRHRKKRGEQRKGVFFMRDKEVGGQESELPMSGGSASARVDVEGGRGDR